MLFFAILDIFFFLCCSSFGVEVSNLDAENSFLNDSVTCNSSDPDAEDGSVNHDSESPLNTLENLVDQG